MEMGIPTAIGERHQIVRSKDERCRPLWVMYERHQGWVEGFRYLSPVIRAEADPLAGPKRAAEQFFNGIDHQ